MTPRIYWVATIRIPTNCTTAAFLHVCISSLCVCTTVCMFVRCVPLWGWKFFYFSGKCAFIWTFLTFRCTECRAYDTGPRPLLPKLAWSLGQIAGQNIHARSVQAKCNLCWDWSRYRADPNLIARHAARRATKFAVSYQDENRLGAKHKNWFPARDELLFVTAVEATTNVLTTSSRMTFWISGFGLGTAERAIKIAFMYFNGRE